MESETKSLAELAELVNGELFGDPDIAISGFNDLIHATAGEMTFLAQVKSAAQLSETRATAIIVPSDLQDLPLPAIKVKNPYLAAALIHNLFYQRPASPKGIHATAHIGLDCTIAASASVGPHAVIGNKVVVGDDVVIEAGVVVGDDVEIGEGTVLEANVVVRDRCMIGRRVVLYSGAVIGSDGFGYATDSTGNHVKRPQVGNVIIEDEVEIGANTCVDRATFGSTVIGKGTKIDNLIQIAHNVEIGQKCLLVSQCGIAGSTKLGNNVVISGQVAIKDHVEIGDRVMVAGKAGVTGNIAAGQVVAGFPAIPHKEWLRAVTSFSHVPKLLKDIRQIRRQLSESVKKEKTEEQ